MSLACNLNICEPYRSPARLGLDVDYFCTELCDEPVNDFVGLTRRLSNGLGWFVVLSVPEKSYLLETLVQAKQKLFGGKLEDR